MPSEFRVNGKCLRYWSGDNVPIYLIKVMEASGKAVHRLLECSLREFHRFPFKNFKIVEKKRGLERSVGEVGCMYLMRRRHRSN